MCRGAGQRPVASRRPSAPFNDQRIRDASCESRAHMLILDFEQVFGSDPGNRFHYLYDSSIYNHE